MENFQLSKNNNNIWKLLNCTLCAVIFAAQGNNDVRNREYTLIILVDIFWFQTLMGALIIWL
jgi:hypothetical protein